MMIKRFLNLAGAAIALAAFSMDSMTACAAVVSELYLTTDTQIYVVQGNSVVRSFSTSGVREFPIAVNGTVRTTGFEASRVGREYTLGGTPTGPTYAGPLSYIHDGTTDGAFNYAVRWRTGDIYRFDTDWSNPQFLFNGGTSDLREYTITYDKSDNTLWTHDWQSTLMKHFSMTGTLLGSFNTQFTDEMCLALDHADGTLWLAQQPSTGQLHQYNKAGVYLGSTTISGLPTGGNMRGGEFDLQGGAIPEPIPEPSTLIIWSLLGALTITLGCWRRRRAA